jgi:hypothetical protein
VRGEDGAMLLRRVLAYQHVSGGDERQIRDATRLIEAAGSPDGLLAQLSTGQTSLWRLGPERALALEIAINHIAERRQLEVRLHGIEAEWRTEDALADIVDEELS